MLFFAITDDLDIMYSFFSWIQRYQLQTDKQNKQIYF